MSLNAIQHLREAADLPDQAKKLLSFTDNRQDASLQAGHFNDFVQVTLLRAALYRAAVQAGEGGLEFDELPQKVFAALDLPFGDYAREPELKGLARSETEKAFQGVLAYRIYLDLERGWRLTQQNLEQCGLLKIDYPSVDDLAADVDEWAAAHPALVDASPEMREFLLRVLLDSVRRDLAIRVESMQEDDQERLRARSDQRLEGSWALDEDRLRFAPVVIPRAET